MAHILVIDDDQQIRTALRQVLEIANHKVTELADGSGALAAYQAEEPDLVITDIIMPDQEGLATIVELQKVAPQLKIIAISGGGKLVDTSYLNVAERLGASRVLAKPFDRHELMQTVESLLAESQAA